MDTIVVKANAKINLTIDVVGKRPDGYHNLEMIMQPVHYHDSLHIEKTIAAGFFLEANNRWLPTDRRNLIFRAYDALFTRFKLPGGLHVSLTKRIPICAGLGGGSADCAAALSGIRRLYNLPLGDDELLSIGAGIGSDVPFCLFNRTALVTGVGNVIHPLPEHPLTIVLIVKPRLRVSTRDVFSAFSMERVTKKPDTKKVIEAIQNGDIPGIAAGFCNVLDTVTKESHPIIASIEAILLESGAAGAGMSGSGPSVFGYFKNKRDAAACIQTLNRNRLAIERIILTSTFNRKQSM